MGLKGLGQCDGDVGARRVGGQRVEGDEQAAIGHGLESSWQKMWSAGSEVESFSAVPERRVKTPPI
jgi:hypothetical protein